MFDERRAPTAGWSGSVPTAGTFTIWLRQGRVRILFLYLASVTNQIRFQRDKGSFISVNGTALVE